MKYVDSFSMLWNKAYNKKLPFQGLFEITPRCNFSCGFCYICNRLDKSIILKEKKTAEWLDMIRQSVDAGMFSCGFTGGDPFMRADFEEIYSKAYDMGLRTSILTNGSLITKDKIDWLKKRKPDRISISLYGSSPESYKRVTGDSDNFEKVLNAIMLLKEAGLSFNITALGLRPLIYEYEAIGQLIINYKSKLAIDLYISCGRDDTNRSPDYWRIPINDINTVISSFTKSQETIDCKPSKSKWQLQAIPCTAGKCEFSITYDGRMLGCPKLTCFEASPFETSFMSAWESLKTQIQNAQICKDCERCSDYDGCYKCPAVRLAETGSITQCSLYLKELAHVLTTRSS